MNIKVNEKELKEYFAYLNADDLLYTLKRDIDYLESHNKNYTKAQYNAIIGMQAFLKNCTIEIKED